jgi:hypothetical protein
MTQKMKLTGKFWNTTYEYFKKLMDSINVVGKKRISSEKQEF